MSSLSDEKVRELLKVAEERLKYRDWVTVSAEELIVLCKVYLTQSPVLDLSKNGTEF